MDYKFLNNLLSKKFTKFFPKTINRKLLRRYGIFFVPTKLKILPKNISDKINKTLQNDLNDLGYKLNE